MQNAAPKITVQDFGRICRVCLAPTEDLQSIYGVLVENDLKSDPIDLVQIFFKYCNIQVSPLNVHKPNLTILGAFGRLVPRMQSPNAYASRVYACFAKVTRFSTVVPVPIDSWTVYCWKTPSKPSWKTGNHPYQSVWVILMTFLRRMRMTIRIGSPPRRIWWKTNRNCLNRTVPRMILRWICRNLHVRNLNLVLVWACQVSVKLNELSQDIFFFHPVSCQNTGITSCQSLVLFQQFDTNIRVFQSKRLCILTIVDIWQYQTFNNFCCLTTIDTWQLTVLKTKQFFIFYNFKSLTISEHLTVLTVFEHLIFFDIWQF